MSLIKNPLTEAVADSIKTATNGSIADMQPFHSPITNDDSIGVRTMAEGREGMVRLMCNIALQHIDSLPRNEDPKQMVTLLASYSAGSSTLQAVAQLKEMLEDTQLCTGIDLMALYDRYNGYLQTSRKADTALDASMKDIDTYDSRFGGNGGDEPPAPPTK